MSFKSWWKHEGKYLHYEFINGIKHIFRWLPTIWKDRQWDKAYFYDILKKKLELQLKYWQRDDIVKHEGMESDIRYMKICIKLIDRIKEDYYSMKVWNEMEEKWGKYIWGFEKIDEKDEDGDALYELKTSWEKVKTPEDQYNFDKEYNERNDWGHKMDEKAKKLLFKIISERINHWWI